MQRFYAAIDLKSFYASVECVERGLDPLATNLVVADQTRTDGTICLAVSPSLKKLGLSGRARLFEVKNKAREYKAKTGKELEFIVAPPRMRTYLKYSQKIYDEAYSAFIAPSDIYRYSIDEVFIDLTSYLKFSNKSPEDFTSEIVKKIYSTTGLTATAGVGTNLYLAKVAMDILAKHAEPDKNGVRLASLNEESFKKTLWQHRPLTDFWGIGRQTAKKFEKFNLFTFGDLARVALKDEEFFYKILGVNAEIFIDHLWGIEPVTLKDIKSYRAKSSSLSCGQVLGEPVDNKTARLLLLEMADNLALSLSEKSLETNLLVVDIIYDKKTPAPTSHGSIHPEDSAGSAIYSSDGSALVSLAESLFNRISIPNKLVKRIYLTFGVREKSDKNLTQLDLFAEKVSEKKAKKSDNLSKAILDIQSRYGKNAILKAMNYEEGATLRSRNHQIGGHHE